MAPFGASYNPASVLMGRPSSGGSPYLWTGAGSTPPTGDAPPVVRGPFNTGGDTGTRQGPVQLPLGGGTGGGKPPAQYSGMPATTTVPASPTGTLAPRNVRATGTGPFDPAYRQNLASYGGGQFAGNLSFNPTDVSTFPGQATGGGTAPVTGMPQSLLDVALAGQGFSFAPPAPPNAAVTPPQYGDMQSWMDQFMRNGRGLRQGSFL